MKSIKPGRGPSGIGFAGSIIAIVFGIFWTIITAAITAGFGVIGIIFPLFGILFIVMGIIQAIYNYKNATGKNRYSILDITDSSEERDPSAKWINNEDTSDSSHENSCVENNNNKENKNTEKTGRNFCPYCGTPMGSDFVYCPKCGKSSI